MSKSNGYPQNLVPDFSHKHPWEVYSMDIMAEYRQSIDEGLDIEKYEPRFREVNAMPRGRARDEAADELFRVVLSAPVKDGYPYDEPSDLDGIKASAKPYEIPALNLTDEELFDKVYGAWLGRICGCMLGKTVEGITTDELVPLLTASDNYPMHRYITRKDAGGEVTKGFRYNLANRPYADEIDGMPPDDDTNYVVLAQELINKYGKNFTPQNMADFWLDVQPKNAYCTAERVAFINFIKGYEPPFSAIYKNPYREWIGAQIRGDYFGYINPGNPVRAAEMAYNDACISHVKNGIYGEMWAAAMIATAATTCDYEKIIRGGLSVIPQNSRLYKAVTPILLDYKIGVTEQECFASIHTKWNEHLEYDWCHTISNAMIVTAALLYGKGDFGKSICLAVQTGFDTDCNGATVGSVIGMAYGSKAIGNEWSDPINGKLHTTLFGVGTVDIKERAEMTMRHIKD